MATYPVILYPRLIADFRKTHQLSASVSTQQSDINKYSFLGTDTCKKRSFSFNLSIALMGMGAGLVAFGLASLRSPLLNAALLLGVLVAAAPLLLRDRKSKVPYRSSPTLPMHPVVKLTVEKTNLRLYLSELADTMRGKVLQPDGVTDAPVGASEEAFRKVLERFFPERVSTQLRLPIPNWDGAYSTDFTISFPEIGVWIDVEIDEPYDYKSSLPTHCADDERDRNRNSFFLKNNWIVVRFSEEQVVRHPESCCKEIASVIQVVTGMTMYSQFLATAPTLMPMPMWTQRQAKKMAKAKSRDKYLKLPKVKV